MAVTTPPADSTGMPSAGASGADPAALSDAGPGPGGSQAVSSQESAAGEVEPDPKKNKKGFQLLPSLEGWRGLAHYRTESRRKVVKKKFANTWATRSGMKINMCMSKVQAEAYSTSSSLDLSGPVYARRAYKNQEQK